MKKPTEQIRTYLPGGGALGTLYSGHAKFDANLIFVFMTVFQERSVSKAAKVLGVGQPAVSGSIARLRAHFNDTLFYRSGHGVAPTATAERIARDLFPALKRIEIVLFNETAVSATYAHDHFTSSIEP